MHTFDLPYVERLKPGHPSLHPPHRPLVHNSRPLLGHLGQEKARQRVTNRSGMWRTLPQTVLEQPSLLASWRPPKLQPGLRRVANAGEGRSLPLLNSLIQRGGPAADPDVMATIRQLPPYLKPVVTLLANMIPPNEESRIREKRGKKVLNQATSMIIVLSTISLL